jgi:NADH-quinone oxidoreductase subunit N
MLAVAMAVFMFSLAGVPPTAGFMAKFYVFTAAWEGGLGWLALVGVLSSAVAAFFYLRVVVRMFMQEPVRDVELSLNRGLTFNIGLAAIGTLLIGLIPTPVIFLIERSLVASGG